MRAWQAVLAGAVAFGAWQHWQTRPVAAPPGVLAPQAPEQTPVDTAVPFGHQGYRLRPLARFALEARALAVERYHFDREADLAPIDVAFGWGPMSDSAVLAQLAISQGGRFYHWRADTLPLPVETLIASSANMHLIPADAVIEHRLAALRPGQVVRLAGWLVEAEGRDGWRWRSSLTRTDTGAGACELVYVREFAVR